MWQKLLLDYIHEIRKIKLYKVPEMQVPSPVFLCFLKQNWVHKCEPLGGL